MKFRGLVAVGAAGLVVAGGLLGPAAAETTTIDATISTSLTMNTAPSASVNWSLAATGANTTSGGSMNITSNVPYKVTVKGAKDYLTAWDGTAYDDTKKLASATSVTATSTAGTGVGALAAVSSSVDAPVATGIGGGTDNYTLQLSQPTTIADKPLAGTSKYRNVLTYTLSSTL